VVGLAMIQLTDDGALFGGFSCTLPSDIEHVFIAGSFFHYAGLFDPPISIDISPNPGRSDPLYIVKAAKKKV
jgi:hypothetical protein